MSALLTEGTIFAGRYRLLRRLATGGMGAVYEAVHLETERPRALKVMHPHLFQSDEMRERFKREARIAAKVESEHIVDVSDAGVDEATKMPFLVMELLRGEDLGERLKRLGGLPPGDVVAYLRQTAFALDKTHAQGIVHRDLKPENLFLTQREDGTPRIKILDFGIAKIVRDGATSAGATQALGSPMYMAPEQFRIGTGLAPAADIYALGMMAFTLLVGRPYWRREMAGSGDVLALVLVACQGPKESALARAASWNVTLPPAFDAWFVKATAINPGERFECASEAVNALADVFGITAGANTAAALPLPGASKTSPGVTALEAHTATSAALTLVQGRRRRSPLAAIAAVAAVGVLGIAAWLAARPHGATSAAVTAVITAVPPAMTPAVPANPAPSVTVSVTPVEPALSATPSAAGKAPPRPPAPPKKPPAPAKKPASLFGQE